MADTVPMFSPDGQLGDIPADQVMNARKAGFMIGVNMKTADGKSGVIPANRVIEAAKSGLQVQPYEQQEAQHAGGWHALWTDLVGMLKGIPDLSVVPAYPGAPRSTVQQMPEQIAAADQQRQQEGRGKLYRAMAAVASGVVNVPGMEQSAREGDVSGVIGHAAAPVVAGALTEGATRIGAKVPAAAEALKTSAAKLPVVRAFVDGPPHELMTRAVKPGNKNIGWNQAVQKALPEMKAAEADLGHPVANIEDAQQTVTIAKKKLWDQYKQKLGPAAEMGAQIDGNGIADAMVNSIDKRTAMQNPNLVERVKAAADTYRRPITVDEAEDFLQSANRDLDSYYAKNKVGRQVAENDPETVSTVAEAEALRKALYAKLDQVSGPGAFQLKQRYGALSNVERELANRANVAARQQPQSLAEQVATARGYGKIVKGVVTASPGDILEGSQSVAMSKWLKERNSTNGMIQRAFAKTTPNAPVINVPVVPIRGLLPRGPLPLGPSTLNDEMQVLRAKSRVVRDPRTGRMQRQYLTSGQ